MIGYLIAGVAGGIVGAVLVLAFVWYLSLREARYLEQQKQDQVSGD